LRAGDTGGRLGADVGKLHLIIAGFGEKTGYQSTDFSGAKNQDTVHAIAPNGGGAFCPFGCT
jgi:hypothetical protein